MIIVQGSIEAMADKLEDVLRLSLDHVRRSRHEAGCISHNVSIDAEKSHRLVFFEEWSDMSALQAHFAAPESVDFVRQVARWAIQKPEIRIFEALQVKQRS